MAPADGQGVPVQAFQVQLEMPQRGALQAFDTLTGDQRVAVDTHEAFAKLVFGALSGSSSSTSPASWRKVTYLWSAMK